MSAWVEVYKDYQDLVSISSVCDLLRQVAQDPQTEEFDLEKSAETVRFDVKKVTHQNARRAIIGFLNRFTLVVRENQNDLTEEGSPIRWFFYENHTRLVKILIVSKIAEYENLRSFGTSENPVQPKPNDTPSALIILWNIIGIYREKYLSADHSSWNTALLTMDRSFLTLCPASEKHACALAAEEFFSALPPEKNSPVWLPEKNSRRPIKCVFNKTANSKAAVKK